MVMISIEERANTSLVIVEVIEYLNNDMIIIIMTNKVGM